MMSTESQDIHICDIDCKDIVMTVVIIITIIIQCARCLDIGAGNGSYDAS